MVFNLRKQSLSPMLDLILPDPGEVKPEFGIDQPMVDMEWEAGGQDLYASQQEMVVANGGLDAMRANMQNIKENPEEQINMINTVQDIEKFQSKKSFNSKMSYISKGKNKMIKPFNLKKVYSQLDLDPMLINDAPELIGDQLEMQQNGESYKKYNTHAELNESLIKASNMRNAFQVVWNDVQKENPKEPDSAQSALKSYYQDFDTKGEEQKLSDAEVIYKFIYGDEESTEYNVPYKAIGASVNECSELIKKLAQNIINKNNKKAYNLTKTAQHKTLDNAIMWGPGQTRIDPFLHQPVSDWHIVERNKGFGLVIDDIWNIDYETLWRENIMDKYSRAYKNKDGEWVGGYLNKRFEIDRNIPETSNIQLKPGQRRRPILPEYGNTEARLQDARSKGNIEGSNNTSKPFNWKEASSNKKKR